MQAEIDAFDDTDFKTLACSTGKKITTENLAAKIPELIARIGVITGISIPSGNTFLLLQNELEKTIKEDSRYANLTFNDFVQAFTMTANNDFGEIKDYAKSLSINYFRTVLNAYLLYRSGLMIKFDDWRFLTAEKMKLPEKIGGIEYRLITESIYQEYISGAYNPFLWITNCYDCLAQHELIPVDAWEKFNRRAKQIIFGELNKEIMKNERTNKSKDGLPVQLGKNIQSLIDLGKIQSGESMNIIERRAKQLCMEAYFKQLAMEGSEFIFKLTN
jgi:hypothetical protein